MAESYLRAALATGIRNATGRLLKTGAEASVGNQGDSYDNALIETINGLYKAELIASRVF